MSKMRVAVAQMESISGDVAANIAKHEEYIRRAQKEKADVLLFPELSLTGYHIGPYLLDVAMRFDDSRLLELAKLSGNMRTMVGFANEGISAQFFNAHAVLHEGEVRYIHRKVNLPHYGNLEERKHFADGRQIKSFHVDGKWRANILICADLWNPALVHLAMADGSNVIFAPVASAVDAVSNEFSNTIGWNSAVSFYSMMYGMPVVMANLVGEVEGIRFWGGSQIVDPYGKVIDSLGDKEGLLVADLDYEDVRRARNQLPTVRDSNILLVKNELDRICQDMNIPNL